MNKEELKNNSIISPGSYYEKRDDEEKLVPAPSAPEVSVRSNSKSISGFWGLFKMSWDDFGKSAGQFSLLSGLAVLAGFALFLSIWNFDRISTFRNDINTGIAALLVLAALAVAIYSAIQIWSAEAVLALRAASGREHIPLKRIFRLARANRKFVIFSTILSGIIILIGYGLLIIPGLILFTFYQFAPFASAAEDLGAGKSLARSKKIAAKAIWKNLILSSSFFLIFIILLAVGSLFLSLHSALSIIIGEIIAGAIIAILLWSIMVMICPPLIIILARRYFDLAGEKDNSAFISNGGEKFKAIMLTMIALVTLPIMYFMNFRQEREVIIEERPAIVEPISEEEIGELMSESDIEEMIEPEQDTSANFQNPLDEIPGE